jgi:hypothetical protein
MIVDKAKRKSKFSESRMGDLSGIFQPFGVVVFGRGSRDR